MNQLLLLDKGERVRLLQAKEPGSHPLPESRGEQRIHAYLHRYRTRDTSSLMEE